MDVRDLVLIQQLGLPKVLHLHMLAADPTLDLLEQIKYSDLILSIRRRSHFRQKILFTKHPEIS